MRKGFLKIWLLLICILITGCSSVPISSMLKMATMDDSDITALEPAQIRTRITVDAPTELQTKNVRLVLRFEFYQQTESEYEFLLKMVDNQSVTQEKGWFSGATMRNEYTFELLEESIAEFKKYQRDFFKYGKPRKYYWTVYYYLGKRPPPDQSVELDLELKLADHEPYFYLLQGAALGVSP